jgi:hypothetical protein
MLQYPWVAAAVVAWSTAHVYAIPSSATRDAAPQVQLDSATFIGVAELGISRFLGIPYAVPP